MSEEPRAKPAGAVPVVQHYTIGYLLELAQAGIYLVAAAILAVLAVLAFFVILRDMYGIVTGSMTIQSIDIVLGDVLIVFVITGLIQTLIVYIKSHSLDPWLVLSVGLTAIIRRVIVFGAQAHPYEEIALTAALLFVIILGLYLVDRGRPAIGGR